MMNGYFASQFGGISITKDLQFELIQFGIDNTSIQTGVFHPEKKWSNLKKPKVIAHDVLPLGQYAPLFTCIVFIQL